MESPDYNSLLKLDHESDSGKAYAYSTITAYTAYLSANYPLEFFTAALTVDAGNTDDVRRYINACKERGINVLAPSINKSKTGFEIVNDSIVFGLSAIKGVGKTVSNNIIKNRPKDGYKSFGHFVIRNIQFLNKKILDSYTKAGLFIEFGYSKNTILKSIETILEFLSKYKTTTNYDMLDILGIDMSYFVEACLLNYSNKPDSVYYEADSIGIYITKHPLEDYVIDTQYAGSIDSVKYVDDEEEETRCKIAGVISGVEVRKTKQKANMCQFLFTDKECSISTVVFPSVYNTFIDEIKEGRIAIISGFVRFDSGERVLYPRTIELYNGSHPGLMRKLSANNVLPEKSEDELVTLKIGRLNLKLVK